MVDQPETIVRCHVDEKSAIHPSAEIMPISTQRLDADTIVDCVSDSLLAAEILLSRLDRNVSKEKLDLLKFAASNVA